VKKKVVTEPVSQRFGADGRASDAHRKQLSTTEPSQAHLLTVEEAARYMRVSRQTAYDEVGSGKWPIIHVRRRIFVVKRLLDEMIDREARANWAVG
jgi:excisionase family DNA binding protein